MIQRFFLVTWDTIVTEGLHEIGDHRVREWKSVKTGSAVAKYDNFKFLFFSFFLAEDFNEKVRIVSHLRSSSAYSHNQFHNNDALVS
jgi:hypothetical protein